MYKNIKIFFIIIILFFASCTAEKKVSKQSDVKNKISERQSQKDKSLFYDANKQKNLGNFSKASLLFEQCIEANPNNSAAMFELARIYNMQNHISLSILLTEKAADIEKENYWYKLFLAELYKKNSQYSMSSEIFESLVADYPENVEYKSDLALSYIIDSKYKKAINVFDLIEKQTGISEKISIQKKDLYLKINKINKAVDEIKKLISAFPEKSRYHSMLAELYFSNDMPEKAIKEYYEVLRIDPQNPYIHISISDYYRKNGDNEKAYNELKLGFANPDLEIDAKINILLAYFSVNEIYTTKKEKAFSLAKILLETHPDSPKSYSICADFLSKDGKNKEALSMFQKVVALDSSKYFIWEQMLVIESRLGEYELMAKDAETVIELFPMQSFPYLIGGMADNYNKNYNAAIKKLNQGIKLVVDNKEMLIQFYSSLGDAYNEEKEYHLSDDAYNKVLKLDPENSFVLNNYSYYLSLRNDNLEKAEQMAKKSVEIDTNSVSNLDTYAWVLYKLEKYKLAEDWSKKAVDKSKDKNAVILEHYGDILYKLKDNKQALIYWEKAKLAGKGSEFLDKKILNKKLYE